MPEEIIQLAVDQLVAYLGAQPLCLSCTSPIPTLQSSGSQLPKSHASTWVWIPKDLPRHYIHATNSLQTMTCWGLPPTNRWFVCTTESNSLENVLLVQKQKYFHLSHVQGHPQMDKTAVTATFMKCKTKKEVSFWGQAIIAVLCLIIWTSQAPWLTSQKKEAQEQVQWMETCLKVFNQMKVALCGVPVLWHNQYRDINQHF